MKEIFSRINHYLLFIVLLVMVLYYGKPFLIPLVFAAMLAMLMAPVCRWLDRFGFHRALSSFVCVFILILAMAGIVAVIVAQFSAFSEDLSLAEKKALELIRQLQSYVEGKFGVSPQEQNQAIQEQAKKMSDSAGTMATRVIQGITSAIAGTALTLVFTFLFVFSKEKYETFFLKLYSNKDRDRVKELVGQISHVSQQYLTGRVLSILTIGTFYSIGLLIVGIKNAILLGFIAALLTVIPYVGTVLGGLFPVMMALVTEDSARPALLAILVMFLIQTVDNYFIEPNMVGGQVNLNAFTSILSLLAGGMLWGVAGMILFLPLTGIVKIICDHIPALVPIGYILGGAPARKPSGIISWFRSKLPGGKKRSR